MRHIVDNCAYAHLLAEAHLTPGSPVAGQCYFITDHEATYFYYFFKPILEGLGYSVKQKNIPYKAAMLLAHISESMAKMPWNRKGKPPVLTKNTVASTALDFSFTHEKAARDFGYEPIVPLDKVIEATIEDLRKEAMKTHRGKRIPCCPLPFVRSR